MFPKQITSEFFKYTSSSTIDGFIAEIDTLFNHENRSIDLTGKFDSKYEFRMTPKFKIDPFRPAPFRGSSFYEATTIKGYVFKNDKAQTQINILVSPHSLVQLLFFLLPVFYTVIFFTIESGRKDSVFYIVTGTVFIFTLITLLLLGKFLKKNLKDRFVKYFNLSPLV